MDIDKALQEILKKFKVNISNNGILKEIEAKIKLTTADYTDAQKYAMEVGRALTDILRDYLPGFLVDEKLPEDIAKILIKGSMKEAGKELSTVTAKIQKTLNNNANIGINPIIPKQNEDQIDGIIQGIANDQPYSQHLETTIDGIENYYEGLVDDFVKENAEFHYQAGLSPKIERRATGKCCEWCMNLVGTYEYSSVRDTGNNVFRRHKNCHCQVLYNPGDGSKRRQNVHTKSWNE